MVIAVPVSNGDGLTAFRSEHFGHAARYAIVDVASGVIGRVRMLDNTPCGHGAGCQETVRILAATGVTAVCAGGMGRGPYAALVEAGIEVHRDPASRTVGEAVESMLRGRSVPFDEAHTCSGH
jgi:predicted Fe-Mo cluster-binding NifX family protein